MKESRWAKFDKGSYGLQDMQCKKCTHNLDNPLICKKYHFRKPLNVLKCEKLCEYFESKNFS